MLELKIGSQIVMHECSGSSIHRCAVLCSTIWLLSKTQCFCTNTRCAKATNVKKKESYIFTNFRGEDPGSLFFKVAPPPHKALMLTTPMSRLMNFADRFTYGWEGKKRKRKKKDKLRDGAIQESHESAIFIQGIQQCWSSCMLVMEKSSMESDEG